MVKHALGRFLAAAGVAIALVAGPAAGAATAAQAAAPAAAPAAVAHVAPMAPSDLCNSPQMPTADKRDMGCYDDRITANDNFLPAQRWAQAASSLHLRTGDGFISDLSTRLQRDATFPMWMAISNTMWMWATNIVSWAVSMDLMKSVGLQVDIIAAKIGSALFSSAIIAALVGVGLIVMLWRAARGRSNPWGYIIRVSVIAGLMTAMVLGAQQSTVSGGQYRPGKMSPGWLATTANSIVSSVASAPALAISNQMTSVAPDTATGQTGILSCDAYTASLATEYASSAGGSSALVNKLEASVPMLLSRMWEQTGLEVWKTAQFGANNDYGDYMYCRLLEENAGTGEVVQMMLTQRAANRAGTPIPGSAAPNRYAAPWGTGGDVESRDRSLIAWASCRLQPDGNWAVAGDWTKVTRSGGRSAPTADDCRKWWSEDYYTDNGPSGWLSGDTHNFEFSGKAADTRNDTRNASEARDFLLSLHGGGSNAGGNTVMVIAYAFSSLMILLVFLFLGGAVLIAKVAAVVMAMSLLLLLAKDLLPGQEGNSAAAKLAKTYLGITFVTFGLLLLLSLVAVVSGFLVDAAASGFGRGSTLTVIWTGAAPLLALLAIHLLFTKVFKVPSPLTINGAKAWGDKVNSGAMGNAMTSAVTSRAARLGSAASHAAGRAASNAGAEVLRRTTHGRLGNGPQRRAGAGVGTAAAAGAAGAVAGGAVAARAGRMTPGGAPTRSAAGTGAGGATPVAAGAGAGATAAAGAGAAAEAVTSAPGGATSTGRRAAGDRRSVGAGDVEAVRVGAPGATAADAPQIDTSGASGPMTGGAPTQRPDRVVGDEAQEATDEQAPGDERAERKAARAAQRQAVLDANAERRGYGTTRATRAIGDVREAMTARLGEVRQQFAAKPVRRSLRAVGTGTAVAAATVATGGLALPVIAAASAISQTHKARDARHAAVQRHEERRAVERAAAQAAERRRREREESRRRDALQASERTQVRRRDDALRRPSRTPRPAGRTAPAPRRTQVAGSPRQQAPAAPRRSAAPAAAQRPAAPAVTPRPVAPRSDAPAVSNRPAARPSQPGGE